MLGMRLSASPRLTQGLRQVQAQRQEIRLALQAEQTGLQISLAGSLRNERYVPQNNCPNCGRALKPNEILAGFSREPTVYTATCPGCKGLYTPRLICFGEASTITLQFYCKVQVRDRLRVEEAHRLTPAQIALQLPSEYRSTAIHYGTLRAVFLTLNQEYSHPELEDWQGKVMAFLGKMPDTVIANCVGVHEKAIARIRRQSSIPAYNKRKAAAQIAQQLAV